MKKTIVLILAFVMCVSLLSACGGGGAAETKPAADGGVFTYTYENGVLTISGKGVLDYDAMEASGAANVLQSATEAVHVVLEEGVTEIGENAFLNCSLTSVTIPNPGTVIAENSFDSGVTINQG